MRKNTPSIKNFNTTALALVCLATFFSQSASGMEEYMGMEESMDKTVTSLREWNDFSKKEKANFIRYFTTDENTPPSSLSDLLSLDLMGQNIGITEISKLAEKISNAKNIHTIKLSYNLIKDEGTQLLAKKLKNIKNVKTIKFDNTGVTVHGISDLLKSLEDTEVHTLFLNQNWMGDEAGIKFSENVRNTNLHTAHLMYNWFSDGMILVFAENLRGTKMRTVNLYGNAITEKIKRQLKKEYSFINWIYEQSGI